MTQAKQWIFHGVNRPTCSTWASAQSHLGLSTELQRRPTSNSYSVTVRRPLKCSSNSNTLDLASQATCGSNLSTWFKESPAVPSNAMPHLVALVLCQAAAQVIQTFLTATPWRACSPTIQITSSRRFHPMQLTTKTTANFWFSILTLGTNHSPMSSS